MEMEGGLGKSMFFFGERHGRRILVRDRNHSIT